MWRSLTPLLTCAAILATASPAVAGSASVSDRVEELQQELDSLIEDVEDVQEPVNEFELFEECMYLIGVSEPGGYGGPFGFGFGAHGAKRPALALDIRGFGSPTYQFLAFPGEEPPSIECNEDAGQEDTDD